MTAVVMVMMGMSPIRMRPTRCIPAPGAASIFRSDSCSRKTRWIRPGSRRSTIRATLRRRYPVPFRSFSTPGRCWIGITPARSHGRRLTAARVRRRQPTWGLPARRYPERRSQEIVRIGGTWYTGTNFPAAYQNRYYFADWGQGLIKTLTFDANDKPVALGDFASNAGAVVSIVQHPIDGSLYYISYNFSGADDPATLLYRQPDADRGCIRGPILWPHAAGGAVEQQWFERSGRTADHLFVELWRRLAGQHAGEPGAHLHRPGRSADEVCGDADGDGQRRIVGASDVDRVGERHAAKRDDHQPGRWHSLFAEHPNHVNLTATVSDAESSDSQLLYQWQVLLHHNDHNHGKSGGHQSCDHGGD